jgi:hypothetical protein
MPGGKIPRLRRVPLLHLSSVWRRYFSMTLLVGASRCTVAMKAGE